MSIPMWLFCDRFIMSVNVLLPKQLVLKTYHYRNGDAVLPAYFRLA